MSKRKRKKLRDKFTDALGEEISSRENLNIENIKKASNNKKVDLKKKVKTNPTAKVAPPITEIVEVPKGEDVSPVEVVTEIKVEFDEVKITPKIDEVKVDSEFEKRVFAEANDNFFDEKPKRPRHMIASEDTSTSRSAFRAKLIKERIAEEKELEIARKKTSDKDADLRRTLTRAEMVGAIRSIAMLAYSLSTYDKPLFFMAMSLLSHTLRPLIGGLFGKYNRPVQNALHGFSIVLFFGALFFLFF